MNQRIHPHSVIAALLFVGLSSTTQTVMAQEAKPVPVPQTFAAWDTNQDGHVSLEEWLASRPAEKHPRLQRDFRVVDWDGNGVLSEQEFLCLPGVGLVAQRGNVPDPMMELAQRHQQEVQQSWANWDANGDGALDEKEFVAAQLPVLIPGLGTTDFKVWDRNGNGWIERDEVKIVINAVYAITRLDGFPLRRPNGLVFDQMGFRHFDADGDGFISVADWMAKTQLDETKAKASLAPYDQNQDGKLSPEEAWGKLLRDPLAKFLAGDKDLDGLLSPEELQNSAESYQQELASHIFPGFDTNGDGQLDFQEYRLCPLANFDEPWHLSRSDKNSDGLLSLQEFGWGRKLESMATTALFFKALDVSNDQQLDLNEFRFRVDPNRVPPQIAFVYRDTDRDGKLSLDEWIHGQSENEHARLKRDFQVVDWNGDGWLSEQEFLCLSGIVLVTQRGSVPDPMVQLAEQSLEHIQQSWANWDTNDDGSLDEKEFASAQLPALIPELDKTEFLLWDRNGNGSVDADEVKTVIHAAYAITRLDGFSLRKPNGLVFDQMGFRHFDADGDGFISVADWMAKTQLDETKAKASLAPYDQNQDGKLSLEEAWGRLVRDPLAKFLASDKDFDGLLSPEELQNSAESYQQELASHIFPGFDTNGDGQLDFQEYRLCPLANFDEPWHLSRSDKNSDGLLSLQEFGWGRKLESMATTALFFKALDVSNDQQLDLNEFHFRIELNKVSPQVAFVYRDTDRDGKLSLDEWIHGQSEKEHARLKRDFQVVDWNGDGGLDEQEYFSLPGVIPAAQRGPVPDPVQQLAAQHQQEMQQSWANWDTNGDGALEEQEFSFAKLHSLLLGLERTEFKTWDLNGNGKVEQDEVGRIIDAAYGIRHLDGVVLRQPNGFVLNRMGFRYYDVDGDGFISVAEWMSRSKLDEQKAIAVLQPHDQNHDGKLSPQESWGLLRVDILSTFLRSDKDFDGYLTPDEVIAGAESYQKEIASRVFPGFDTNGDGKLDFREYRLCPLANYDEAWHEGRTDRNADGQLTLQEFGWGRTVDSLAMTALIFAGFDVSKDGQLSLQEFSFKAGTAKPAVVPPTFAARDTNQDGQVSLEELLTGRPAGEHARLTRDFRVVDWDGNGVLSEAEFLCLPGVVLVAQRGNVPDPILQLAEQSLEHIQQSWANWDTNGDGVLDQQEFIAAKLPALISGLAQTDFKVWDRNGNGSIERDEVRTVIDGAYAITRLDGFPLRRLNGLVFDQMGFRHFDADGDGFISVADWMAKTQLDEVKAKASLAPYDQNQDGRLSPEEAWGKMLKDPLAKFLASDKDFDGLLSPEELQNSAESYQKDLASHIFPGFDANGDGQLDFREYRLCPLANFDEPWHLSRSDKNADGLLSLQEFGWGRELESLSTTALFFQALDVSQDQQLDLNEFTFSTTHRNPQRDFQRADQNRDGLLDVEEFLATYRDVKLAQRDFQVFDFDADGKISSQEYRSIPSKAGVTQRTAPLDPILERANEVFAQLEAAFRSADLNGNDQLDEKEFRNGRVSRQLPGLQLSTFRDWDRNRDGVLTIGELRQVVDAAYGISRFDGLPYRASSGITFNNMLYLHVDENRDDRLSKEEYLKRGYGGTTAEEKFREADQNGNGVIDFAEWTAAPHWIIDPVSRFLECDKNLNGTLSQEEITASVPEWQRVIADRLVAAFDADGDGELSLAEYRRTPLANVLAPWYAKRGDRDGDGHLSFGEFYEAKGIPLTALAYDFFNAFDRDQDGKLSLNELDFRVDPVKAPIEIAFRYYDTNQDAALTLQELLVDYQGRTDAGAQATIGRWEEMFLAADRDGNRQLSLNEFREGRGILSGSQRQRSNHLSAEVARNRHAAPPSDSRFWIIIAVNILLVGGVVWYALSR